MTAATGLPAERTLRVVRTLEYSSGRIYFKEPKTKRSSRTIALHDKTAKQLLAYRHDEGQCALIFTSEVGETLDVTNVLTRYIKPCLLEAGLATLAKPKKGNETIRSKFRMYDFRHTHATMLLKANVHPKVVSERLGHASVSLALATYAHVLPTIQETAVAGLGSSLFAPLEPGATPEPQALN